MCCDATDAFSLANFNPSNTGAETTNTGMAWFVLAMVWFPEVQKKAQAQLDEIVGRDRMPVSLMNLIGDISYSIGL